MPFLFALLLSLLSKLLSSDFVFHHARKPIAWVRQVHHEQIVELIVNKLLNHRFIRQLFELLLRYLPFVQLFFHLSQVLLLVLDALLLGDPAILDEPDLWHLPNLLH